MDAEIVLLVLLAMASFEAVAQIGAAARQPFDLSLLVTYAWVIGVSCLGGAASFVRKVRAGQARAFNLAELVGELVVSAFTGIVTYWFCRWAEVNEWAAAALIAISAHMGTRAIFLGEQILERLVQRVTGQIGVVRPEQQESGK